MATALREAEPAEAERIGSEHMQQTSTPLGSLQPIIAATQAANLTYYQFFLSWSGVVTVAFQGLPPELAQMKVRFEEELPFLKILKPENPGSKWPKVSLGALRDGKRLSFQQLVSLRRICSELESDLQKEGQLLVNKVSVVLFSRCSLEETVSVATVPLRLPCSNSMPSERELHEVQKVMDEFAQDRLEEYWFYASKDGNRISHYRNDRLGATLVHFLTDVPATVRTFRRKVDAEMPDMYEWFRDEALHVTIRALC